MAGALLCAVTAAALCLFINGTESWPAARTCSAANVAENKTSKRERRASVASSNVTRDACRDEVTSARCRNGNLARLKWGSDGEVTIRHIVDRGGMHQHW